MSAMRMRVLLGVAGLLAAVLVWNWVAGWGLVTVQVEDERAADVARSIERQGGVRIVGTFDPDELMDMDVYRVPVAEAVEVLAARLDAQWSVVYVGAPVKAEAKAGVELLASGELRDSGWRMLRAGGGFLDMVGETVPDPRWVSLTVSAMESGNLQDYLDQFAQKSGVASLVPEAWNPELTRTPGGGEARKVVRGVMGSVGGTVEEVFFLRGSWVGRDGGQVAQQGGTESGSPAVAARGPGASAPTGRGNGRSRGGDGDRREPNPEWIAERVQGQIAQLPEEERAKAQEEFNEVRAFFTMVRLLPEAERRARMEQFFNDPKVQARMEERRATREERAGPAKRADRYRRYLDRKATMTSS